MKKFIALCLLASCSTLGEIKKTEKQIADDPLCTTVFNALSEINTQQRSAMLFKDDRITTLEYKTQITECKTTDINVITKATINVHIVRQAKKVSDSDKFGFEAEIEMYVVVNATRYGKHNVKITKVAPEESKPFALKAFRTLTPVD
jgi:hypothetical protein